MGAANDIQQLKDELQADRMRAAKDIQQLRSQLEQLFARSSSAEREIRLLRVKITQSIPRIKAEHARERKELSDAIQHCSLAMKQMNLASKNFRVALECNMMGDEVIDRNYRAHTRWTPSVHRGRNQNR